MTTVQITLPDELAQQAASAGLLSAEAMETMLREQLRRQAAEALNTIWQRLPGEDIAPDAIAAIAADVHEVRAEHRLGKSS